MSESPFSYQSYISAYVVVAPFLWPSRNNELYVWACTVICCGYSKGLAENFLHISTNSRHLIVRIKCGCHTWFICARQWLLVHEIWPMKARPAWTPSGHTVEEGISNTMPRGRYATLLPIETSLKALPTIYMVMWTLYCVNKPPWLAVKDLVITNWEICDKFGL